VPGVTYHPLEIESEGSKKSEIDLFREAAHEGPPREEMIGLVALDSGLRASAIAHMTGDWLDQTGLETSIDVPQYQRCRLGNGSSGRGGDTTKAGVPCSSCKKRSTDQNWLPPQHKLPDHGDCWRPKSESGYKGREIPIKEPDTAQAVESYFRVFDDVATKATVRNAIIRIADRAGILEVTTDENGEDEYWPTTHDLRNTFGTRLAIKDFGVHEIKSAMGHADIEQAVDYVELSGRATKNAFDKNW
jgi:hypothetical protein